MDAVLLGEVSAGAAAHLAGCEDCRARGEQFQSSVGAFEAASLAWSEARSHTMTRGVTGSKAGGLRATVPAWGLTAIVVFGSLVVWSRQEERRVTVPAASVAAYAASADSEKQIATDNVMLAGIDSAVGQTEPSPLVSESDEGLYSSGDR